MRQDSFKALQIHILSNLYSCLNKIKVIFCFLIKDHILKSDILIFLHICTIASCI